jgi:hypothetical protein
MKRTMTAIILGTAWLPAVSFSHDGRRHDHDRWRHSYDRVARPRDPGYYCDTHKRKIHRDDTRRRRHCHSIYNDPHRDVRDRDFRYPWRR